MESRTFEQGGFTVEVQWKVEENLVGWPRMGCIVTVSVGGVEVGHDSIWGIESVVKDYADTIEAGCIAEALHQAYDAIPQTALGLLVTATRLLLAGIRGAVRA